MYILVFVRVLLTETNTHSFFCNCVWAREIAHKPPNAQPQERRYLKLCMDR